MTGQNSPRVGLRAAMHVCGPAPCQLDSDPERWFPTAVIDTAAASALCSGCPALTECLAYALAVDERFGIWGGTTAAERHRLANT